MVILHIDTGVHMRGGQWQVFYLLRELIARGHRVRLLAPRGSPLLRNAIVQQYDAVPLSIPTLLGASSGVDLIHAHDAHAHTLALLGRRPVIVSRRVAFPVRESRASRWKYRRAAHFIAVSECVKRTLMEARTDASRISVVYDGVPIPPLTEVEGRSHVVALDSNDPGKGKKLIERAAQLANIRVHFSNDLGHDLAEAALFVYITELEGLGSAALLAMANQAPVIASNVGGLPEIIEDGVTGLLTSNEPGAVAMLIQRLIHDRPLAARLASAARTRVEEQFSVHRMVDETVRVYERILN